MGFGLLAHLLFRHWSKFDHTPTEIGLYFQAIFEDKEEEVKKFLAPPYNVNIARLFNAKLDGNDFRWTALQAAAFYGASNSIRALMAAGAAVEQQDEWFGGRALAWACYGNHPEVAKMLMDEFKADPKAENNGGQVAWDLVADKTEEKWKGIILSDAEWTKQRDEIIAKLPKDASGKLMVLPSGPPPPSKSKTLLAEGVSLVGIYARKGLWVSDFPLHMAHRIRQAPQHPQSRRPGRSPPIRLGTPLRRQPPVQHP